MGTGGTPPMTIRPITDLGDAVPTPADRTEQKKREYQDTC